MRSSIQSRARSAALLMPAILVLSGVAGACGGNSKPPVYESTADRNYLGSIYYSKLDCVDCHGAAYDGKGESAADMEGGLKPTDFKGKIASGKTPMDYFLAITDPEGYFAKNASKDANAEAVSDFAPGHKYLTYTDEGRWAMANFLYEMGQKPDDMENRKKALAAMDKKLKEVYDGHRRWEIGFTKVEDRVKAPTLDELIQKAGYSVTPEKKVEEIALTPERIAAGKEVSEGARLYQADCEKCHGAYGEGRKIRYGLTGFIPMLGGFPRENELKRQNPEFIVTVDLKNSGAMASQAAFQNAHTSSEANGMLAPLFTTLSSDEWTSLYNYARKVSGR